MLVYVTTRLPYRTRSWFTTRTGSGLVRTPLTTLRTTPSRRVAAAGWRGPAPFSTAPETAWWRTDLALPVVSKPQRGATR